VRVLVLVLLTMAVVGLILGVFGGGLLVYLAL
jgi:hypothetical protein